MGIVQLAQSLALAILDKGAGLVSDLLTAVRNLVA